MRIAAAIRVDRHPCGPRVYAAGFRVHHGTTGLAAIVSYPIHRRRAILLGGLLALAHDFRDFPFRDCDNHDRKAHR
jgi:hypothetical protein